MKNLTDKSGVSIVQLLQNHKKRAAKGFPIKSGEQVFSAWLLLVLIIRILVNTFFLFSHHNGAPGFYQMTVFHCVYLFILLVCLAFILPFIDSFGGSPMLPSSWGPYPAYKRLGLALRISFTNPWLLIFTGLFLFSSLPLLSIPLAVGIIFTGVLWVFIFSVFLRVAAASTIWFRLLSQAFPAVFLSLLLGTILLSFEFRISSQGPGIMMIIFQEYLSLDVFIPLRIVASLVTMEHGSWIFLILPGFFITLAAVLLDSAFFIIRRNTGFRGAGSQTRGRTVFLSSVFQKTWKYEILMFLRSSRWGLGITVSAVVLLYSLAVSTLDLFVYFLFTALSTAAAAGFSFNWFGIKGSACGRLVFSPGYAGACISGFVWSIGFAHLFVAIPLLIGGLLLYPLLEVSVLWLCFLSGIMLTMLVAWAWSILNPVAETKGMFGYSADAKGTWIGVLISWALPVFCFYQFVAKGSFWPLPLLFGLLFIAAYLFTAQGKRLLATERHNIVERLS
ncbi:MAG: hypothetical protein ACLFR1_05295 [Spirochaetia bacterium]